MAVKRRGRHIGPLRKVVGYEAVDVGVLEKYEIMHEKLECGHLQLPVKDIIGETNAFRRRCRKCGQAERA